ncbi:MAG: hypothetical protein PVI86_12365 [Phycisphaerae bacterium]
MKKTKIARRCLTWASRMACLTFGTDRDTARVEYGCCVEVEIVEPHKMVSDACTDGSQD